MNWTKVQVEEAISNVVEKAGTDAEFRTLAISDIHAAVKEVTGKEIPEAIKINVVDSTGYHVNIVLSEVQGADDELTEAGLETVAGGSKAIPVVTHGQLPTDCFPTYDFPRESILDKYSK